MLTQYIKVDKEHPAQEEIAAAGEIIRRGGLVAFPTETVYGLGADAYSAEAAGKIYAAKGRPSDNPLIVHIADRQMLCDIVTDIPPCAKKLMDAFWPGPMTLVFNKQPSIPSKTSGGLPTVAVRMPSHPVAAALIRASGCPIAAPSANSSGRPSPTAAEHVREDMDGKIEMIVDGGACDIGLESTIIDVTGDEPMLLRPGYISVEDIRRVCGSCSIDPAIIGPPKDGLRPKAPGMMYRHYAPRGDMLIVEGEEDAVVSAINREVARDAAAGLTSAVICASETACRYECAVTREIGNRSDDAAIARNLFALLREMDRLGIQKIYTESFSGGKAGMAIMNRMLKAAGYREKKV